MNKVSQLLVRLYWLEELEVKAELTNKLVLGKNRKSSRLLLENLINNNLINCRRNKLFLSPLGRKLVEKSFPLWAKRDEKWSGFWWAFVFDLSAKERSLHRSLLRFLRRLGFGLLQQSTFISPYDWSKELRLWFRMRNLDLTGDWGEKILLVKMIDFDCPAASCWPLDLTKSAYLEVERIKNIHDQFKKLIEAMSIDPWLPDKVKVSSEINKLREGVISTFLGRLRH